MGETNVLFSIGPLEVTGAVVTMWVIIAVLALLSWLATRRLRDVPGPLQNAAEMAVEKLQGFYGGILGPANARRYFPMTPVRRSPSIKASFDDAAPRLACVKPVASVHPEPGSNSSL